ncbi:MAG: mechanosensitive ion channel family protein [Saprospiraceae bacterium]|nr:mechanosensitive ion channel family protein [Saprospiraceae bacterium]
MTEFLADYEIGLSFFAILIGTFVFAAIVRRLFGAFIKRSTRIMQNDPTNYQFIRHSISALIYLLGIGWAFYMVPSFRTISNSLLTGAGILAVVAGFASQHALSNIMSGIFIVIFKPFRVNDRLRIRNEVAGIVEDITLRHTVIRDFENKRVIIPNSVISNEIIVNSDYADDKICKFVEIGISYDSNVKRAKAIMEEEALKHPFLVDPRTEEQILEGVPIVPVRVLSLGDFSVNLRAWVWASNQAEAFVIGCDLLESIKERFDAEGIEIPFPYRTIVYKTPANQGVPEPDKNQSED